MVSLYKTVKKRLSHHENPQNGIDHLAHSRPLNSVVYRPIEGSWGLHVCADTLEPVASKSNTTIALSFLLAEKAVAPEREGMGVDCAHHRLIQ